MEFDKDHAYALRIESHNHPSAVEPYGGAATGIGGIVRDVLCMGAQPIALVDPLFFGPLDYPADKVPPGTKHPKYLFGGVVAGIRDYGNRIGIPTVAGGIWFDDGIRRQLPGQRRLHRHRGEEAHPQERCQGARGRAGPRRRKDGQGRHPRSHIRIGRAHQGERDRVAGARSSSATRS